MRAWLSRNKAWFVIAPLCILFTLGLLGLFRLIFGDSMFGVRMEFPENMTEMEKAEHERSMRDITVTMVGVTTAAVLVMSAFFHYKGGRLK